MAKTAWDEGLINLQFVTVETFVIQFVILLIVLWVLNKFLFKPYLAYLDEWEAKQKKVQDDYNNAEALLEAKKKEGDDILENARKKGNAVIEEAETLAKSRGEKIIQDAENSARDMKDVAQTEIEKERNSMLSWVKEQVISMALKLNGKIFRDETASKDFMEKNIDTL